MMYENKLGELTSRQLIIIVILIISFVIILAFFFMLDLGGEIDKESCRNSVMMRKTFSILGIKFFSLKCKTQDVCLSMGEGCEESVDETIKVEDKNELMKEMANLLADCWWMMGEGKVDYGDKGDCAICYKVYFDIKDIDRVKYTELHDYMKTYKISDNSGDNYLNYLYGMEDVSKIGSEHKIYLSWVGNGEEYAIITGMNSGDKYFPPRFVKFSSEDLGKECTNFVTEV